MLLESSIIHAYISVINPKIQLWLTEGMALYLSNGDEFHKDYMNHFGIPSYQVNGRNTALVGKFQKKPRKYLTNAV